MTDQPDFINLNYTSFAKKEGYKPPQTTTLFSKKPKKRQRFIPGGEWADDTPTQPTEKLNDIKQIPTQNEPTTFNLLDDIPIKQEEAPKPKSSKFAFIKKSKKPKTKTIQEDDVEEVLLSFEDIRSEK